MTDRICCPICQGYFDYRPRSIKRAALTTRSVNGNMEFEFVLPEGATAESIPQLFEYTFGQQVVVTGLIGGTLGLVLGAPLAAFTDPLVLLVAVGGGLLGGFLFLHDYSQAQMTIVANLWRNRRVWSMEKYYEKPEMVELNVRHDHRTGQTAWYERPGALPVSIEKFDQFAYDALSGVELVGKNWYPLKAGKLLSQIEYVKLMDMLKTALLVYDGTLTHAGRLSLRGYLLSRGLDVPQ